MASQTILVTGGAGYIGSHACLVLLEAGYDVVVVDNLSNASEESLNRVRELTGKDLAFHEVDLVDADAVEQVFAAHDLSAVMHFAGLKAVGESTEIPLRYYDNNITGTLVLLEAMKRHKVTDFVFSSSATVYGDPASVPITEDFPLTATNPYGWTKLMIEQICRDVAAAEPSWRMCLLRYFNPVGAHGSGRIGEDPSGIPNNLMPYIMQVAVGRRERLGVFGNDYDTTDGTGVRDYIHVMDLVEGHVAALKNLENGCHAFNLGRGKGYSVLQMLAAASKAVGKEIPHEIQPRRPGDIAECFADASRAETSWGWKASRGVEEMCQDHWRWQSGNPNGYGG
jgi:UDP-glucose 4-epimerase